MPSHAGFKSCQVSKEYNDGMITMFTVLLSLNDDDDGRVVV